MRRLSIVPIVLFGLTAALAASQKAIDPKDPSTLGRITQTGFQPLQAERKILVIDVREAIAFEGGRIPGALNVPLAEIESRIDEIRTKAAGRPIVTYCSCPSEGSAAEAGLRLYRHGLADVRALIGGYPDWVRSGGKVERH